jgi:hypothetical protein
VDLKRVPKWAWVVAALVAVGVYLYFRSRSSGSSAAPTTTDASPVDTASLGGTPQGDTGGGAGGASGTDLGTALGDLESAQQQFLADFLANQQGMDSAGISPADWQSLSQQLLAQIGALQSTAPVAPGSPIQPDTAATPAPTPAPAQRTVAVPTGVSVTNTPTAAALTVPVFATHETQLATQHGAGGQPVRYYTYKKQVPVGAGQTLHFATGRGYYAA